MDKRRLRLDLTLFIFLLIVIAGILLRVYQIDYNLDGDEIFSVRATSSTFSHMMDISMQDRPHPPLHNILLFLWIKIWGSSEISVRMLSVLASLFFLIVLYKAALMLIPKWPSLFVVSICAFGSFFVYFGQQARPYALVCLFATLTVYLLVRNRTKPSAVNAVLYFFSCAALVYTQYLGVLILLPQFAMIVFSGRPGQKKMLIYGFAGMLCIAFWLLLCSLYAPITEGIERVAWIGKPSPFDFASVFLAPFDFLPFEGSTRILITFIAVILSFLVIKRKDVDWEKVILLGSLALFGPIVAFMASHVTSASAWADRQLIGSITFFICLLGFALALVPKWPRILLGLILVVWSIFNVPNAFPENSKFPCRSVADSLSQKYPDHDIVVQTSGIGDMLDYYSNKKANIFGNENLEKGAQCVFVSHHFLQENVEEIEENYRILEKQMISYGREKEHSIRIYLLEKIN